MMMNVNRRDRSKDRAPSTLHCTQLSEIRGNHVAAGEKWKEIAHLTHIYRFRLSCARIHILYG